MNSLRRAVRKDIDLEALAFAVARNHCGPDHPIEEVLATEGISLEEFTSVLEDKIFQTAVKKYTKELTENGTSFQLKARLQAEELLARQFFLIHDPETPPAVAVKAIENTVRWAGLEPKTSPNGTAGAAGAGFQIIFNLNGAEKPEKVISFDTTAAIEAV